MSKNCIIRFLPCMLAVGDRMTFIACYSAFIYFFASNNSTRCKERKKSQSDYLKYGCILWDIESHILLHHFIDFECLRRHSVQKHDSWCDPEIAYHVLEYLRKSNRIEMRNHATAFRFEWMLMKRFVDLMPLSRKSLNKLTEKHILKQRQTHTHIISSNQRLLSVSGNSDVGPKIFALKSCFDSNGTFYWFFRLVFIYHFCCWFHFVFECEMCVCACVFVHDLFLVYVLQNNISHVTNIEMHLCLAWPLISSKSENDWERKSIIAHVLLFEIVILTHI